MKADITTIKLDKKTKKRLEKLRIYKRQTYDEIVQNMLNILNLCRLSPERARARLVSIDRAKRKQAKETRNQASLQSQDLEHNPQTYSETH